MLKKIRNVVIAVLAVLGVLFIILMLLPDDEEAADGGETQYAAEESVTDDDEAAEIETEQQEQTKPDDAGSTNEDAAGKDDATEAVSEDDAVEAPEANTEGGNAAGVSIPSSEISDMSLKFRTLTLDNKEVSQDVFGDYDLTVVYIWGTYCGSCIKEMGDYAALHKDLPDNVNLIGLMVDVYDGIDSNVSDANKILNDAGAEFVNIRTSDSLYDLLKQIQYIPSSVIVDREGHVVGQILEGATCNMTEKALDGYLK